MKHFTSLFNNKPKEEDFVEVYDVQTAIDNHVDLMWDYMNNITDEYDRFRKDEMKEKGSGEWQGSRRTTKEKAIDKKELIRRKKELHLHLENILFLTKRSLDNERAFCKVNRLECRSEFDSVPINGNKRLPLRLKKRIQRELSDFESKKKSNE